MRHMFVTDKAANNLAPVSKTGAITRHRLRLTTPGVIQCAKRPREYLNVLDFQDSWS
jgi:hypothetical protein